MARVLGPVFAASEADVVHVHNLFTWTGARRLKAALPEALRRIDMAVSKGVFHRKTGSRYVSRLAAQVAALGN